MTTQLNNSDYMKFPLTIGTDGAVKSSRREHVRELIEQVLFTDPRERWFRPEFGVGVRTLVFEPNNSVLWEVTKKRLLASLSDALAGEVEASTLDIQAKGDEEKLNVLIAYKLATINHTEKLEFVVEGK
jgi:phage baseplate assembly protein W